MRLSWRELGWISLCFAVLTLVFAYPVSVHPATLRLDTGIDGDLGWYLLSWDTHAFLHRPWAIFDANIYHPSRFTLAYGENIIGLALLAAPVIWLTGSAPMGSTFVSLSACFISGLGAYVLARRLRASVIAAIVAGIIFECAPPHFFRIGQITLAAIGWIPFALASMHAYMEEGRPRDLRLAAACVTLQVLSSGHGAVFIVVSLLLYGLWRWLLGDPIALVRRLLDLGIPGVLLLLPAALSYLPYRYVQATTGLRRGLGGNWDQGWQPFLASPSHLHQWLYRVVGATSLVDAEVTLFPGFAALLLAGVAVVAHWRWSRRGASGAPSRPWIARSVEGIGVTALLCGAAATVVALNTDTAGVSSTRQLLQPVPMMATTALLIALLVCVGRFGRATEATARWPLRLACAAAIVALVLGLVRPALRAGTGLQAEFTEIKGVPTTDARPLRTVVPGISTAVLSAHWPDHTPERFTARWTGYLFVPDTRAYTLILDADDTAQLLLDNGRDPVVSTRAEPGRSVGVTTLVIERGAHLIDVRYEQRGDQAALELGWGPEGGAIVPLPDWALSLRPTTYMRTVGVRWLDRARLACWCVSLLASLWAFGTWWRGQVRPELQRWSAVSGRDGTVYALWLTVLGMALALGPPFGIWQYVYWMPLLNFIRASSRFTLVALLGLGLLAGLGFDALTRAWPARRRLWAGGALVLLLLAEYAGMPMGAVPIELDPPTVDRWLSSQSTPFIVAEAPARTERDEVDYMLHSTVHWQKTVHGYDGWRDPLHEQLFQDLRAFPDPASLLRLQQLRVTYVVVHVSRVPVEERLALAQALEQSASTLRLVHTDGIDQIYAVTPLR